MILVFGGTTEGRIAVDTLDEGAGQYYYSTRGSLQKIECAHGEHIAGAMTKDAMMSFCREKGIKLIVDAAHPFAQKLHGTISAVSELLGIPAIRLERRYPVIDNELITFCDDYNDAVTKLCEVKVKRLLALTGVQTIAALKGYWRENETWFRILDREESLEMALDADFPRSHLVFYGDGDTASLIDAVQPDAIITKESGSTGGYEEKIEAASGRGIKIFVIRRPALPQNFIIVDGCHGLRREVERLIPEFYSLHTGFTTGSCAVAAAKAALTALLTGEKPAEISFRIPEGETMRMQIESVEIGQGRATAAVIKAAGNDPDVTDGCRIEVEVAYAEHQGIKFIGGKGVGTVTLPGLGLEPGEPAINPVPRKNISDELLELYSGGLDVTVSLENGEELAEKTFNPRVGVVGGVSIIGTTGIVRPFSHEAFVDCMRREVDVSLAMKCGRIVVNSGGKSERYMKGLFPSLPPCAFIHYGNAVGEIMKIGREKNVSRITIGLMLGKAVKLAEGNMDTHSHKIVVNKEFLKGVAEKSGCSADALKAIENFNFARELPSLLDDKDAPRFFGAILSLCRAHCAEIFPGVIDAVLLADDGRILSRIGS